MAVNIYIVIYDTCGMVGATIVLEECASFMFKRTYLYSEEWIGCSWITMMCSD